LVFAGLGPVRTNSRPEITNALGAFLFLGGNQMTRVHMTGIRGGLCAISAALILLALAAAAQSPPADQARQWCFGSSETGDEQRIDGCTIVLQADPSNVSAFVAARIAGAYEHRAI
jgi:hypothetical protein